MGLLVADFEVTEPSLLTAAGSTEVRTDCTGWSALCELTMPGTAESTEVGSDVGNCLGIRDGGFDDAWGVLNDTLDAILAVPVAKPWLVVAVECVVKDAEDAGDVASEEASALGSRPLAAPTELCSSFASCSVICCMVWGDSALILPRMLSRTPNTEASKPVQGSASEVVRETNYEPLAANWRTASEFVWSEAAAGAP